MLGIPFLSSFLEGAQGDLPTEGSACPQHWPAPLTVAFLVVLISVPNSSTIHTCSCCLMNVGSNLHWYFLAGSSLRRYSSIQVLILPPTWIILFLWPFQFGPAWGPCSNWTPIGVLCLDLHSPCRARLWHVLKHSLRSICMNLESRIEKNQFHLKRD